MRVNSFGDLGGCGSPAADRDGTAEQEPWPTSRLADEVVRSLLAVGLRVQNVAERVTGTDAEELAGALAGIDSVIRAVRDEAFREQLPALPPCPGDSARGARAALAQARRLHERLHRVSVALSLTEDLAADSMDQLARSSGRSADRLRMAARRARVTAQTCREMCARLDALAPGAARHSRPA